MNNEYEEYNNNSCNLCSKYVIRKLLIFHPVFRVLHFISGFSKEVDQFNIFKTQII